MSVAILIKTLGREPCLFNTLDSIRTHCGMPHRLYIADDGPVSAEKRRRYERLQREGHIVLRYDSAVPVTAARNALVRELRDEEFLLRIDDDFEFFEGTNLLALLTVLEADPTIGAVADIEIQCGSGKGVKSGEYSSNQGFLKIQEGVLLKSNIPVDAWEWRMAGPYRYALADHTRNFLMIRRACIEDCPWDERIFIEREHIDFMLSMAAAGWKLAFTPDSAHRHRDDLARQSSDEAYRVRRKTQPVAHSGVDVLAEKWGILRIESHRHGESRTYAALRRSLGRAGARAVRGISAILGRTTEWLR